jgi:nitroimidazol reductase NimA-like FMN-containing flavoprotein (pyridoxamine 5'-phosphate oxidase superfamily)
MDGAARRPAAGQGSRKNQRAAIKMTPEEIDAFLQEGKVMNCATLNRDGSVHLVAMWYGFLEGAPAFHTKAKSQKIANLRRDSRITCLIEEGETYGELRGLQLVGRAEIVEERARLFELAVSTYERSQLASYNEGLRPRIEAVLHNRVGVKLHCDRMVTWDHRKLDG